MIMLIIIGSTKAICSKTKTFNFEEKNIYLARERVLGHDLRVVDTLFEWLLIGVLA